MAPGRITEQSHSGPAPPKRFSTIRWLGGIAATAAIYFVAGRLALLLAIPPGYATAGWPAAGLALGCILLFGNRRRSRSLTVSSRSVLGAPLRRDTNSAGH